MLHFHPPTITLFSTPEPLMTLETRSKSRVPRSFQSYHFQIALASAFPAGPGWKSWNNRVHPRRKSSVDRKCHTLLCPRLAKCLLGSGQHSGWSFSSCSFFSDLILKKKAKGQVTSNDQEGLLGAYSVKALVWAFQPLTPLICPMVPLGELLLVFTFYDEKTVTWGSESYIYRARND